MQLDLGIKELYPKQIEFCESEHRHTCYGGARGGGKSFIVRIKAVLLAIMYPGIQILLCRRTLGELQENHLQPLLKMTKSIARYRGNPNYEFSFVNGSRIKFAYCKSEADVLNYQGQNYEAIFLDEATNFTEFQINCFIECNRLSGLVDEKLKIKPRMYYTANPGGVSHAYIKRLFVDRDFRGNENPNDYKMIFAKVYDNKFLMENDPDYVKQLENLPEKRRLMMLDGDWNVFEGQFFEEFDTDVHVIHPIPIQKNWKIYRTRDYGLDKLACYWIAVDEEGFAYVYKELYESNLIVTEAGRKINDMTTAYEQIYSDIMPPDLWNKNSQTGKSASDIFFSECGQIPTKANNDRINGWLSVKEWLTVKKDQQGNVRPKLVIFDTCKNLIRTLPLLQHDERNPNDVAKEPHELTHAPDALRYFCTSWTYTPTRADEYKNIPFDVARFALNLDEDDEEGEFDLWN